MELSEKIFIFVCLFCFGIVFGLAGLGLYFLFGGGCG